MSIESKSKFDVEPSGLPEQQRTEEEQRVREIERRIYNWSSTFFEILRDHYLLTKVNDPDIKELDQEKVRCLIDSLPRDLIQTEQELKYFLSKVFLMVGKLEDEFGNQEEGTGLAYAKNSYTLLQIITGAIGYAQDIKELSYSRPVFYREDKNAHQEIKINDDLSRKLPQKFFDNPTNFIERLNLIERDESEFGNDIDDLFGVPYDFTKLKKYKKFVFKRVDLSKVEYGIEEIDQARKIKALLSELGDSETQVQQFVGFVYDQGNIYLISRFVPNSDNLWDRNNYSEEFQKIQSLLREQHIDLVRRNVLVQFKNSDMNDGEEKAFVLIDFETKK